jgi:hypothetical protein
MFTLSIEGPLLSAKFENDPSNVHSAGELTFTVLKQSAKITKTSGEKAFCVARCTLDDFTYQVRTCDCVEVRRERLYIQGCDRNRAAYYAKRSFVNQDELFYYLSIYRVLLKKINLKIDVNPDGNSMTYC